jgi:hypothetical protein
MQFLQLAQANDLFVLMRPGPYVCGMYPSILSKVVTDPCCQGEWEFGGFPPFLLSQTPPVTIRTYDNGYIAEVDKW